MLMLIHIHIIIIIMCVLHTYVHVLCRKCVYTYRERDIDK